MATTADSTVVAVFQNASDAQAAANELKANGFSQNDIYISSSETGSTDIPRVEGTAEHEGGIKGCSSGCLVVTVMMKRSGGVTKMRFRAVTPF
ncbi:MAG TPA: general stress protein [Bryobacteraceae bacterium]|nr:general stress protein [Bryobacteraceae bacterium]